MRDYPNEEAQMSDEREVRADTEEPELESDDVEAHVRANVRAENDEGSGDDDVEAHVKLPPGDVKL